MEGIPKKEGLGKKLKMALFGAGAIAAVGAQDVKAEGHYTTPEGPWEGFLEAQAPAAKQMSAPGGSVELKGDKAVINHHPYEASPAASVEAAPVAPVQEVTAAPTAEVRAAPLAPAEVVHMKPAAPVSEAPETDIQVP